MCKLFWRKACCSSIEHEKNVLDIFVAKFKGPLARLLCKTEVTLQDKCRALQEQILASIFVQHCASHSLDLRVVTITLKGQPFSLLGKSDAFKYSTQAPHHPGNLFGPVFYLYKIILLWSRTFLIFTSLNCNNHKIIGKYKICVWVFIFYSPPPQFSKDLRSFAFKSQRKETLGF